MSRTSEYTIDLVIQDDKSKDAIRALENSLKNIGKTFNSNATGKELTRNLEETQKAAQEMIGQFHEMAKDSSIDFQSISKAYSKNAGKAIAELENQYAGVKDQLDAEKKRRDELNRAIRDYNVELNNSKHTEEEKNNLSQKLKLEEEELRKLNVEQLEAQVQQNRQIRFSLKEAEQMAKLEHASAKQDKLNELQKKRSLAVTKSEKKALDEQIKQQKALIKSVEMTEKAQKANGKAIKDSVKQTSALGKALKIAKTAAVGTGKAMHYGTQFTYNVAGLAGGAARGAKAIAGAGIGIASQIGGGISAVAGVAEKEVERERFANRIKGYGEKDRNEIMHDLYIRTGADYSTIVDAIGRVQGTLGRSISKDDLVSATAIELRYPGTSQAFASTNSESNPMEFQVYANRLKAIQNATGASEEQIQASAQAMANLKSGSFRGNARVTEFQAIYLGLQNSGAFDSQEELDKAFQSFVRGQKDSNRNVFEYAQNYDWEKHIYGDRNRLQASNTLKNINWMNMGKEVNRADEAHTPAMTESETMAMKMRDMEDKKNQLLLKLIPAVFPIVEKISELLSSSAGQGIIDGLVGLFKTVIPLLEPVFSALEVFLKFMQNTILPKFQWLCEVIAEKFGEWFGTEKDKQDKQNTQYSSVSKSANGGIAFGPTLVGERSFQPEMILPLDYSRSARAGNIVQSVSQTFNMSGNETTALSLAQAVSSRDFSRAMGRAAFKSGRLGVF